MSDKWNTHRARRVRVCAVLAMHVPNPGIHTLCHFSVHPFTSSFSPQVRKKVLALACSRRGVKVGLFKTLGFVLRCAVARHFPLSLLQETKEEVHNTHDALIA